MKRTTVLSTFAVIPIVTVASTARADWLGDMAGQFQSALDSGSYGLALSLIYAAGLVTALTPCVYPMIAITVSVFGARQAKSKVEGALLSTAFVLGIAALFTPLGVISALTGGALGNPLGSPVVVVGMALFFIAMAASMFGAFELNLPPALQNKLAQVGGSGYRGAFGVGFVNGLIAAPCTGPVLTVLLTWVGVNADGGASGVGFGALALFVYSLGLGTLFWLVGTFAVSLPKSGRWLDSVKSVFGVIMLVVALYYLRLVLPMPRPAIRSDLWLIVPAVLAVLGFGIGAVHLSFKEGSPLQRARKGAGVTMAVLGVLGLVFWVEAPPPGSHIEWLADYGSAKSLAAQEGKPLLVDFGAEWCNACKEIEHEAFADPRVVAEANRFVAVRVDMTNNEPEKLALLREYRQPGLPLVVLHDENGDEQHRVTGPVSADEFLDMMRGTN